jgi:hypothetical protein
MTRLDIADALGKVEEQKRIALQTPILIFASPAPADGLRPVTTGFSEIYGSGDYFSFHPPSDIEQTLANYVHRTIVLYFYRSDSIYQEPWLKASISPALANVPTVDLYTIDMISSKLTDPSAKPFKLEKLPTVLVYRMGHEIERILPEIENETVAAQVAEYINALRSGDLVPPEVAGAAGKSGDLDRKDFENRIRDKQMAERKREEIQKAKDRAEVRRRIAEDKAARKKK